MDSEAYKRLQSESVTGHTGTSELEVQLLTSSIQVLLLLNISFIFIPKISLWLLSVFPGVWNFSPLGKRRFLIEFLFIIAPQVIIFIYPKHLVTILVALLGTAVLFGLPRLFLSKSRPFLVQADYFSQTKLPFVTNFRASIMILTIICILAVDFSSFPRSWAKTESFGTSLMDVGVGCIVFASGLVSAPYFAAGQHPSLLISLRSSLAMLILGLLRLGMVKLIGYQEHVSEYGMHWNFFLSLAILPVIANLFSRIVPVKKFMTFAFITSSGYELILQFTELQKFLLGNQRENLIQMNKEGIFSLIGCLCLFLFGCGIGTIIQNTRLAKVKNRSKLLIIRLFFASLSFWILYFSLKHFLALKPSRRLVNLPFVLWTCSVSCTHLFCLFLLDATFMAPFQGQSSLLVSINDNQLLVFLLGNLGTGLVNLLFQTLLLGQPVSLIILLSYSFVLCGVAVILKHLRLVLRLK